MFGLLLAIIYTAFIGLGLPDSLLGSAWPLMVEELSVSLSYMGIISAIISIGTVVSSLFADKVVSRLGTGVVTAISIALTAVGLFGFALSREFWLLCVFSVPYGLGAGAVDAALNNYVALHYSSRHMSWLHCFWGVGAAAGPYIMGGAISLGGGWRAGYGSVAGVQVLIVILLFCTLPLWRRCASKINEIESEPSKSVGLFAPLKIKGVWAMLIAFFCYCAFEATAGLWASSYLVEYKGVAPETAAIFASFFYLGITVGRFISGFVANRIGDKNMVRIGEGFVLFGLLLIILPMDSPISALVGLVICGFGAAPIYPSLIHATPDNFGRVNASAVVGLQMASSYLGILIAPPIFGVIAEYVNIMLYPHYMLLFIGITVFSAELVNRVKFKSRLS